MIAKILKRIRSKHFLSQCQLAHKSGLTVTAIANYEQGRAKPSYEVLIKIADTLGVSLDELVGRKFPKKK